MRVRKRNRTVIWTIGSRDDLKNIADYLADAESLETAVLISSGIIDAGDKLRYQATLWRARDDIYPGIRIVFAYSYAIVYYVQDSAVSIARVIHGARDIATILRRTLNTSV